MGLGTVCCTSLMCLVHLLWMSIAVTWQALLLPVAAKVCPCLANFTDGDEVPVSVFELAEFADELLNPVVVRQ